MENKKSRTLIILLTIVVVLLIGVVIYLLFFNNKEELKGNDKPPVEEKNNEQSGEDNSTRPPRVAYEIGTPFSSDKGVGVAYIKGYAITEKQPECGVCPPEETSFNDVVYFVVVESDSEFSKYISFDSFPEKDGKNAIEIGCLENNTISYLDFADLNGDNNANSFEDFFKQYKLDNLVTKKIMSSNANNLIKLKVERYPYPVDVAGDGVSCVSDVSTIEVVE